MTVANARPGLVVVTELACPAGWIPKESRAHGPERSDSRKQVAGRKKGDIANIYNCLTAT